MTRPAWFINQVAGIQDKRYLEIGTYAGETFRAVKAKQKTGIDNEPKSFHTLCMTSDEFFAMNSAVFDIIFIDGDHRFEQVLKDFDNACRALACGGVVFVHDLVPPDETYATREPIRADGGWCGDGYRLLELADEQGVAYTILPEPYGLTRFDSPPPLGP